jgi:hypothetical protein
MSGAELTLIIGLISGIVSIIDGAKKVYDAATDQQGLPEAFRTVAQRLPIVQLILDKAKARAEAGSVDDVASMHVKDALGRCKKSASDLDKIFRKVIPVEGAPRLDRYYKAVRTLGKGSKVETLMDGVLKELHLLSIHYGMGAEDHVGKLDEAVKAISALEPSVPDRVFDEPSTSYENVNSGSGTQNNYNTSGGENYFNSGSGHQITGSHTTFHFSQSK